MKAAPAVLLAVATELAEQAKASMPKLNDGEKIQREWYADGVYYRMTTLNNVTFCYQYDFRRRKANNLGDSFD